MLKLKNIYTTNLTFEEREILNRADEILDKIQTFTDNSGELCAVESGSIVFGEELSRVRGVLSTFSENSVFQFRKGV